MQTTHRLAHHEGASTSTDSAYQSLDVLTVHSCTLCHTLTVQCQMSSDRLTNVQLLRLSPFVTQILDGEADGSDVPSPFTVALNTAASPIQADRIIQTYRGIVNLMASLLLRLDQEGKSDALSEEMRCATRQSVSPVSAPCTELPCCCLTASLSASLSASLLKPSWTS